MQDGLQCGTQFFGQQNTVLMLLFLPLISPMSWRDIVVMVRAGGAAARPVESISLTV